MNKFNLEKLVKVKVIDFYPSTWYYYIPFNKKRYFWQKKEGIYLKILDTYYKDVPKNHKLKDNIVYENPQVLMYFQGGIKKIKHFNTLIEAQSFAEEITKGKNWLFI